MSDFAARFVRNAVNRWFSRVVVFTDLRYRSRTLIRIKLCTNLARSGNSIRWYYSARARVCVRDYNLIVPTIIETPRTCLNVLFIYIYMYNVGATWDDGFYIILSPVFSRGCTVYTSRTPKTREKREFGNSTGKYKTGSETVPSRNERLNGEFPYGPRRVCAAFRFRENWMYLNVFPRNADFFSVTSKTYRYERRLHWSAENRAPI